MMIAYTKMIPEQDRLSELLREAAAGDSGSCIEYTSLCSSECVVTAYDQEQLVGVGAIRQSGGNEAKMDVAIHQQYSKREIELMIMKLLKMEYLLS